MVCILVNLLTNDNSLKHIQTKHFLWNYVYFLIYLHLNNSNDFTLVEKGVWDKIGKQDFSWIPKNDKK